MQEGLASTAAQLYPNMPTLTHKRTQPTYPAFALIRSHRHQSTPEDHINYLFTRSPASYDGVRTRLRSRCLAQRADCCPPGAVSFLRCCSSRCSTGQHPRERCQDDVRP